MFIASVPLRSEKMVCERPSLQLPEGGNAVTKYWPVISDVGVSQSTYCANADIR
jgi:hypothetical protein